MSSLIDNLLRENDSRTLTQKQCSTFRSNVKHMDDEGRERIYVIIKGYQQQYDANEQTVLPYNGTYNKKNEPEFDYKNFPDILKRILCLFAEKHIKTMEDAAELEQSRLNIMS